MLKLHHRLARGLQATALLWPARALVYGWVHRAVQVLANPAKLPAPQVQAQ